VSGSHPGQDGKPTDTELVKQFQTGEDRDDAFMQLFERYGPITFAFLRRRIGNGEVAAEVNQELYLGVLTALDGFRGQASFKTWLFRMAQNRLLNLRRRWRTHADEIPAATPDALQEDLLRADQPDPDHQLAKAHVGATMQNCLAGLNEVQRAVVIGNYFGGETLEQLTRSLRLTNRSGARATLIAAQRKLRKCLEKAGVGARDIVD